MSNRYRYLAQNQPKVMALAEVKVNIWLAAAIATLFFFGSFWGSFW